mmetsp:Transcript_6073/g.17362  ORF Transcript_6073/g.17362 Transcript_6073/m.17362 type:complete len:222 (-) Transcript_6073:630-1295(-)
MRGREAEEPQAVHGDRLPHVPALHPEGPLPLVPLPLHGPQAHLLLPGRGGGPARRALSRPGAGGEAGARAGHGDEPGAGEVRPPAVHLLRLLRAHVRRGAHPQLQRLRSPGGDGAEAPPAPGAPALRPAVAAVHRHHRGLHGDLVVQPKAALDELRSGGSLQGVYLRRPVGLGAVPCHARAPALLVAWAHHHLALWSISCALRWHRHPREHAWLCLVQLHL